jgi:membrane-bound lytic murein transglycosylase D
VHAGQRPIPAGYELRVPRGTGERFRTCVASLPQTRMAAVPSASAYRRMASGSRRAGTARARPVHALHVMHKVKPGQTLAQIASLYGCSVEQIRRGNNIKGNKVHAGQVLRIPIS